MISNERLNHIRSISTDSDTIEVANELTSLRQNLKEALGEIDRTSNRAVLGSMGDEGLGVYGTVWGILRTHHLIEE